VQQHDRRTRPTPRDVQPQSVADVHVAAVHDQMLRHLA
jgi:hypothetical protein